MAEPADINVDELRRRARRRLVGAVVLALGVAVVVPMLLETEQKPLGDDVSVKIPPVDSGKFVNRLNDGAAAVNAPTADVAPPAVDATKTAAPAATSESAASRTRKYDTRVPDVPGANVQAAGDAKGPPATVTPPSPAVVSSESPTERHTRGATTRRRRAPPRRRARAMPFSSRPSSTTARRTRSHGA